MSEWIKTSDLKKIKQNADGFYFRKAKRPMVPGADPVTEMESASVIDYTIFKKDIVTEFSEELQSYKWLILLFEPTDKEGIWCSTVYFQAFIGDPIKYIANQVKAKSQGCVIKKSTVGFDALDMIMSSIEEKTVKLQLATDRLEFVRNNLEAVGRQPK